MEAKEDDRPKEKNVGNLREKKERGKGGGTPFQSHRHMGRMSIPNPS